MQEYLMRAKRTDKVPSGAGWLVSEKLNGMRCFWDGGLSRGLESVPWAGSVKSGKVCTGLWSRYGRPIYAPGWWLDGLPEGLLLDGELYGVGQGGHPVGRQEITSIAKREDFSGDWEKLRLYAFASPLPTMMFSSRRLEYKALGIRISIEYDKCLPFIGGLKRMPGTADGCFAAMSGMLEGYSSVVCVQQLTKSHTGELLEKVKAGGGEGVMFRESTSLWTPQQSKNLLKYKFVEDAEATVVGWEMGRGKYAGMLGSLLCRNPLGVTFNLSGMTDDMRAMDSERPVHFELGDVVNYTYSGLTTNGVPVEARFNSVVEG